LAAGLAADQHPSDGSVAGQPPARLRVQRPRPTSVPTQRSRPAEEAVQVDGHQQLRSHPASQREPPTFQ
jgi:hypothetical protein